MRVIKEVKICIPETTYGGTERKVWIGSDFHYNHTNLCRGTTKWRTPEGEIPIADTRPFQTLEEMNETLVQNINACVGKDDILIHCGDFCFGGFANIPVFREKINCQNIYNVNGNHDEHIRKNKNNYQSLFVDVMDMMVLDFEYGYNKNKIVIYHYPIQSWEEMNHGSIHLHGHCHLPNDRKYGMGRKMDVGIDGHPKFRPYDLFWECVVPLKSREIKSDMPNDHHVGELTRK